MVWLATWTTADKNRVILSGEYPDYIHAVSANVSQLIEILFLTKYMHAFMQGYKQKKAYIIAEGPMASTARNMWKLVYDRKCGVMVMLSDLMENGKVKTSGVYG